jgi:dihydrofolate synthase/folylpolyglutamate synthase
MNIQEAKAFLLEANQYGSVLGLQGIKTLLEGLYNPQDKLKFVHIAGTNGKGSTGAFIASALATAGYRIGRYISPSVFSYAEKIQILTSNKKNISQINLDIPKSVLPYDITYINDEDIALELSEIKQVCEKMTASGMPHPTTFEIETAMAMLHFLREECDLVVLEVGLGGRLDATNVITNTECAVITSISMDHMNVLGDTLEQIATEKAGIIKPGIEVVSYEQQQFAAHVIRAVCKQNSAHLTEADFNKITLKSQDIQGSTFSYEEKEDLRISLLGKNQIKNAVVAILAIKALQRLGYTISEEELKLGLFVTKWSGRFEIVSTKPLIIMDGAHNEDAAIALAENIKLYFGNRKIIYIMGVLADKDYHAILRHTHPFAKQIITVTPANARGLSSEQLGCAARTFCNNVISADTVTNAIHIAKEEAREDGIIIIFGSLSYLGEVYQSLGLS